MVTIIKYTNKKYRYLMFVVKNEISKQPIQPRWIEKL